jgi:lysozyme
MRPIVAVSLMAIAGAAAILLLRPRAPGAAAAVDPPSPDDVAPTIDEFNPLPAFQDAADVLQGATMPDAQVTMSPAGLAMLQRLEGFSATPYVDAHGYSIGYGHFIKAGESFTTITRDQALQLLQQDLVWAERAVRTNVLVPLTQSQFDALVSFVYNVGETNFRGSTLLRKLNAGDYEGALAEFPKWNRSGGDVVDALVERRAQEQQLFEA